MARLLNGLLVLALAGCEANAELGLALGPLGQVLAVTARPAASGVALELVLVGWEEQPLGPGDRVRAGGEVVWLEGLRAEAFEASGSWTLEGAALTARPRALAHRASPGPTRLALLLDNGEQAAAADPALRRLSAARATVDALLCAQSRSPCAHAGSELALVVLERGAAELRVASSRNPAPLLEALEKLPTGAGGASRLWDGLRLAAGEARRPGEGSGAVLGYTAGDSGSTASVGEARASLAELPAYLATPDLPLAGLAPWPGAGGVLPVAGDALERAFLAARAALVGVWRLELELVGGVPAPGQRLRGELALRLGPERHPLTVDLWLGAGL